LSTIAVFAHEAGVAQHAEVLRDGRPTHVESGRNLGDGHAAAAQAIEDCTPRGVGNGVKDVDTGSGAGHEMKGNQLVT
jgi:hypothetical protein